MAVYKVIYRGDVLVDLTADTVVPGVLKKGYTAHNSIDEIITGTLDKSSEVDDIDIVLAHSSPRERGRLLRTVLSLRKTPLAGR